MKIVTCFFGDAQARAKYRSLYARWALRHKASGFELLALCPSTEEPESIGTVGCASVNIDGYSQVIRPSQPFDVKGAVLSEFTASTEEPFLYLDLDACLTALGVQKLRAMSNLLGVSMPIDIGARRDGFDRMLKRDMPMCCAGVMLFGVDRNRPVYPSFYRQSWAVQEFDCPVKPHLIEQAAWSQVRVRTGGLVLEDSWNRHPCYSLINQQKSAFVEHRYGRLKP